jgi:murein L,D-transpeptidase YafK
MQTDNLNLPKNDRNTASDLYIKIGIGIIAILVILNLLQLVIYLKEAKNNKDDRQILQETSKSLASLHDSLGKMEMQKAFVHLAEARRQIAVAFPSGAVAPPAQPLQPTLPAKATTKVKDQPVKQPAGEQKASAIPAKPAELSIPVGATPAPLISAVAGEYALICEKESSILHLFKFQDERFVLIKSYPCIIGANGKDKRKEGDFATPKGSYFTLRYTPGTALPQIYGEGAFVLNYPNFLDRKDSKAGAGIWIHGHVPGKVVGRGDLLNTKGCIAISNDNVRELKGLLKASGTPVSIVDRIAFVKESGRKESVQDVSDFMDAWRLAWESGNTRKYLSYYSKDFTNSEGMTFEAFKRHKERVNRGKKFIRVKVDQMAILFPQEREGQVAIVRFIQRYRSNNFEVDSKKLFYLKKGQKGWSISGESAF